MKVENIKFKAKSILDGAWVQGDLVHKEDGAICILRNGFNVSEVDPYTVCQFTGLKDCKGNEIWEGDIIRNPEFPFEKRTVTWSDNSSCFMPIDEDGCKDRDFSFLVLFKKWAVVGNKFDKK